MLINLFNRFLYIKIPKLIVLVLILKLGNLKEEVTPFIDTSSFLLR